MRYRSVVKMHAVNRMQTFVWPLVIMLIALAIVIAIGYAVNQVSDGSGVEGMYTGMAFNGAIFTVLGPIFALGFMSMGQYFPLALGLGITRREYVLGTALVYLAYATSFTVIVLIGRAIELATGGYGLRVRFFDVNYVGTGELWQSAVQTFLIAIMVMLAGSAFVAAYFRWKQTFVWSFFIGIALVVAVLAILALVSPEFGASIAQIFALDWWAYMALMAAVSVISGAAWLLLVRRTQLN